jgi:hypothetical protein
MIGGRLLKYLTAIHFILEFTEVSVQHCDLSFSGVADRDYILLEYNVMFTGTY